MDTTWKEIVLDDCLTEEFISSFWTISTECCLYSHLVNSLVHCLYNSRYERTGYVSDTETYHFCLWMCGLVGVHLLCNVCEQIVVRELEIVFVY